jgi:hypothetical protein
LAKRNISKNRIFAGDCRKEEHHPVDQRDPAHQRADHRQSGARPDIVADDHRQTGGHGDRLDDQCNRLIAQQGRDGVDHRLLLQSHA